MISLIILTNFKGDAKDWLFAIISCLLLDSIYMLPILRHTLG